MKTLHSNCVFVWLCEYLELFSLKVAEKMRLALGFLFASFTALAGKTLLIETVNG